jgi:hypothetical protein
MAQAYQPQIAKDEAIPSRALRSNEKEISHGRVFKRDFNRVVAGVNKAGESDNKRKHQTAFHLLTIIRLHLAAYFCRLRGESAEKGCTAGIVPNNSTFWKHNDPSA